MSRCVTSKKRLRGRLTRHVSFKSWRGSKSSKQVSWKETMITKVYYKVNYSWTSLQRPPWGQKKVAIVERFKQESMYGLSAQKSGRYEKPGKRWSLWKWSFMEVRLHYKFRQLIFLQHAMDSMSHKWLLMDSYYNCDNFFYEKVRHD